VTEILCLVGSSGFAGSRVLQMADRARYQVRALVHARPMPDDRSVKLFSGDARDVAILRQLLVANAVVVNFAYGSEAAGVAIARSLGEACASIRIKRLVHISSVAVYGRSPGQHIDEESPCDPVTPYERAKHEAEQILERSARGVFELVLLRPTGVFGPGGKNLESLALRVLHQAWPMRYLRACAMDRRRMHAVDVECVAAATLFAANAPLAQPVERFIVSQDDEPGNDYASIEAFFVRRFGAARYPLPPLSPPAAMLRWALRIAGRSNVEPQRRYSAAKLAQRGFARPRPFAAALEEYAGWIEQHARP
jgi:nucleoside-diphosphate-sugar epimerase